MGIKVCVSDVKGYEPGLDMVCGCGINLKVSRKACNRIGERFEAMMEEEVDRNAENGKVYTWIKDLRDFLFHIAVTIINEEDNTAKLGIITTCKGCGEVFQFEMVE